MSLATSAQNAIQQRLPKVIDARTHGIIDYAYASLFLGCAVFLRKENPRAAWAALGTGAFIVTQALLTDYPMGVQPLISFETHGKLDAGFAAASPFIPKLFGFGNTPAANIFRANALIESTAVALTDFNSARAHEEKSGSGSGTTLETLPNEIGQGRVAA